MFSNRGTSRKTQGTVGHEDAQHIDAFFACAKLVEASAIIFEEVFGFCLAESERDKVAPLVKFLERVREELPEYHVCIFLAAGEDLWVLSRHRVFIVMVHNKAGGAAAVEALKRVVEAEKITYSTSRVATTTGRYVLQYWTCPCHYYP